MSGGASRASRSGRRRLLPVGLLVAASLACAGGSGGSVESDLSLVPHPTMAGRCGDDEPGRYTDELFPVPTVTVVSYADGLDADLYVPTGDTATCRAAIVWVHGGGFTGGTRNGPAERAWGSALARRGYTVLSIDYRLGEGEQFGVADAGDPGRLVAVAAAVADAQRAVRWLRESAASLHVDPLRIALGGTSAGAMTALGAALTATDAERVCSVVSVAGAIREAWLGDGAPSALFVHGRADLSVSFESAEAAVAAIGSTGAETELVVVRGAGHEITGVPPNEVVTAVADWLLVHVATACG